MLIELFWSFVQVGLFSVGGGYAAIPLIQSQVVELHGWLSMATFTDLVTIAEMTPGPIAINSATFVGLRMAGVPGAVAATLGCILPSCLLVSLLALLYRRYRQLDAVQGVMAALRPVVVALIASAGVSILLQVAGSAPALNWQGLSLFAAALAILRWRRCSPILVLALCGAAGVALGLLL